MDSMNRTDTEHVNDPDSVTGSEQEDRDPQREYERSGLYPDEGKPFRIVALLGVIFLVMVFMAGAAALIDWLVDY